MAEDTYPEIQFIESIVKAIVFDPDSVQVTREIDEIGVLLTLKVADADVSRVIGKGGQAARSLRTLLRVLASKTQKGSINLKILEPGKL